MVKVLVSFDDEFVRRFDGEARAQGLSRSTFLARAAQRELQRGTGRLLARRQHGLKALDDLFAAAPAGESTADIRTARDER